MRTIKAIITVDDTLNSGCEFKDGRGTVQWENLTREEQDKVLDAFEGFHGLFSRFLKEERRNKLLIL